MTPESIVQQAHDAGVRLVRFLYCDNVGEIRLVPDPASFAVLPYAPHSAAMSCDMLTGDRTPWGACPRSFLKRMRARAAAHGWELQASLEAEFSLARRDDAGRYVPFDETLCFSSIA